MHGGAVFFTDRSRNHGVATQVNAQIATNDDLQEIASLLLEFSGYFDIDASKLVEDRFYMLKLDEKNPHRQLYVIN